MRKGFRIVERRPVAQDGQLVQAKVDADDAGLAFAGVKGRGLGFHLDGKKPAVGGPRDTGAENLAVETQRLTHLHMPNLGQDGRCVHPG